MLYYHKLIFIALQYDTWLIFSLWCRVKSLAKNLLFANLSIISQWFILCVQFDQSLLHSINDWRFNYELWYLQLHSIKLHQRQVMLVLKIKRWKCFLNSRMFFYDLCLNWVARHFLTCIIRDHQDNQCIHWVQLECS